MFVLKTGYQFTCFSRHKLLIKTNQICVLTKLSQSVDVDQIVNLTETSLKRFENTINWLNATLTRTFDEMDYRLQGCERPQLFYVMDDKVIYFSESFFYRKFVK